MKVNERYNSNIRGEVEFTLLSPDGSELWSKKNQIQGDAKTIICHALAQDDFIKTIEVFKASVSLASANVTYSFPTSDSVKFSAIFDELSFNDTLDEVRLENQDASLVFSILTGLSIAKSDITRLLINWTITINDIP